MKIVQKQLELEDIQYYIVHLNIVNALLVNKMTDKELNILANFMSLDKSITSSDMFNTFARKQVKENLDNMSSGSLSNHLKSMLDKGFLSKDDGKINIKPFLIPEEDWQGYQFKITKK